MSDKENSDLDYLFYLNSFYEKPKFQKDPRTQKFVKTRPDFLQINVKHCDTNETELVFIPNPQIDYYVVKDMDKNKYRYPQMSIERSEVDKVSCPYCDRDKCIAERLGLLNEYYDMCRKGYGKEFVPTDNIGGGYYKEINYKKQFIQEQLMNSPFIYMGDMDIEDYYKNLFMEKHGRDIYHKHGCFKHSFLDIEVDQFYDEWTLDNNLAPVNSISYFFKPTKTLYLFVLNNQPNNKDIIDVEQNFDKFVKEFIRPHDHDESIKYVGKFYDSEKELLKGCFDVIHETKPDFCGIWNMNFDIPYIIRRMIVLEMDYINIMCHPDVPAEFRIVKYIEDSQRMSMSFNSKKGNTHPSRLWDWCHISGYTQFYDMMALYSLMRKGELFPSYKLDDIAESETGFGKLDYHVLGYNIQKLSHQNFKIFLSYSAIDTVRLFQIESFTDDFNRSIIFSDNTKLQTSQKISYVIKNKMYRIYKDLKPSKVIGNNVQYNIHEKISGAIIASPDNLRIKGKGILNGNGFTYDHVVDFDEASEYPRVILTFNISKNSIHSTMIRISLNDKPLGNPKDFNKLLQTRKSSIFEIGETYFGLPSVEDMIKKIEKSYDVMRSS